MNNKLRLKIILGSTRQGRIGRKVANWVMEQASSDGSLDIELLDLIDYPLPFVNEPMPPAALGGKYSDKAVQEWAAKISDGDAYLIITPEYNAGYPAVLKNALDHLHPEWKGKAVSFVGYSTVVSAAVRSVGQLIPVVVQLGMVPVAPTTQIGDLKAQVTSETLDLTGFQPRLQTTLAGLARVGKALKMSNKVEAGVA